MRKLLGSSLVVVLAMCCAGWLRAAEFHAAKYGYSTAPDAHGTVYQDDLLDLRSSVGDMNDGVNVNVSSSYTVPDPSVGWGRYTSVDITFDLGGQVYLDSMKIGHAGIPNFAKWAPDDVTVTFSTDGVSFGSPLSSSAFTLFATPSDNTYQRADLVLNTPVKASHVKLSFDGGTNHSGTNSNGYLLDDVSFSGTPAYGHVLPYVNNDPNTALLYHFNEDTGLHSKSPGTNFIGDGSGNGQLLRTNYDTSNPGSVDSNPALSPFDGQNGPPGLGTAASIKSGQRAYRVGNTNTGIFDTETFTIEAWIRNPATDSHRGILRVDDNSSGLLQFGIYDGRLRLAGFFDGGFDQYVSTQAMTIDPDTWYHVAVTYEGVSVHTLESIFGEN
jgi:hypothetical protein